MGMSIVEKLEYEKMKDTVNVMIRERIERLEAKVDYLMAPAAKLFKPKRPYHRKNNAQNAGQ